MPATPQPPPPDAPAAERLGFVLRLRRQAMPGIRNREQLAERLGYSVGVVKAVENGVYKAGLHRYMTRWEAVLGTDEEIQDLGRQIAGRVTAGSLVLQNAPESPPDDAPISTADESARFLAWAEATNVGEFTLEQLHAELRAVATAYLRLPIDDLLHRTRLIRDRDFRRPRPPRRECDHS